MQLYSNGINRATRVIAMLAALAAVASGAATVPGLATYRTACAREVQDWPYQFFDAARDRTCTQAKKDFRRFSMRWHPDKQPEPWHPDENAEGLTEHEQQDLFKCANSAHQRMMRPCESRKKRWDDEEFDSTPRHRHDDICFCLQLFSLLAVCSVAIDTFQERARAQLCGVDVVAQRKALQERARAQLCDIDVVAQHKALQERVQERAPYREMGVYRHGPYMVLQRSTVATVRFRPSV